MRKIYFKLTTGLSSTPRLLFINFLLCLLTANCQVETNPINIVTVSILPQKYFVSRIVGTKYKINVMIPPGHNPATYEPTVGQMRELSQSKIYFCIGHIPFEKSWLGKITNANKKLKIVDTSIGVPLISENHHHHSHNELGQAGVNPHIWLSLTAVKIQSKNILNSFIEIEPENETHYSENYRQFMQEIDKLDIKINSRLKNLKSRKFLVFHPAWSYFARDFNLKQIAMEMAGKSPSPTALKKIIDTAKRENIQTIIVQKQFATHSAQAVADEIGGEILEIDPLAENWLHNMEQTAEIFSRILK